ncbi:MAG: beta-glucosidase BglX [Lewinellaceae bacterium]|nr:beta-glucosidase BglX [Lewinellaceae bacterium]
MNRALIFLVALFLLSQLAWSQVETGKYLYKQHQHEGYTLNYRILYPYDFDENKRYPLVLFLHGRGESGDDNEKQLVHGSKLFLDSLDKYPAVVIFPQCPETDYWSNIDRVQKDDGSLQFTFPADRPPNPSLAAVMDLAGRELAKPYIDENRLYVTGLSMGGMGTFELLWRMPEKIAAAAPICGGGAPEKASAMTDIPIWIFHGMKDDVVPPGFSIRMLKAIQQRGGLAKITLYPEANHNAWDPALAEPDFLPWMFSQYKGESFSLFVDSLMSEMTLEEKLGQLNLATQGGAVTGSVISKDVEQKIRDGQVGGIFGSRSAAKMRKIQEIAVKESRLGIPLLTGMDVIHGHQTIFPIPLGMSCTWDPELIKETARTAAREATADGIMWNFSPMVDISRDPRWGRIAESSGEDPFLGARIAEAMVRGYQQDDLADPTTMLACVKHYAAYGAPEGGRDYATVDMSRVRLHNEYLPPYKAAIDAGVGSVMTAFNVVDYVPASANEYLYQAVLRDEWGFDGFVVTDYTAVEEMIDHGLGDLQQVSAMALKAGIDMDMVSEGLVGTLKKSLEEGLVTEAHVDRACRRILIAKERLGLFEDPYRYFDESRAAKEILSEKNRAFSREVAGKSAVLLKNEGKILPLSKSVKIALVGPLADSRRNMMGTWSVSGDHSKSITVKEGLESLIGQEGSIRYAKGANISDDPEFARRVNTFGEEIVIDKRSPEEMIAEAVGIAKASDVIVAVMGEAADMSGESSSLSDIGLQPSQVRLLKALKETGKPIVLVLFNGRPMTLTWEDENMDAILDVWHPGIEAGYAVADLLFGDVNPSGKLTMSFPVAVGQIPVYHSMLNTGRPYNGEENRKFLSNYLDIPNEPLYPFGYGLSYTQFEYGKPALSHAEMTKGGKVTLSVTVKNTGERPGAEVVQMYIRDVVGSISRPVKELKGFEKITLQPGEEKTVRFPIDESLLQFCNGDLEWVVEPGLFQVFVGPNSRDVQVLSFEYKSPD